MLKRILANLFSNILKYGFSEELSNGIGLKSVQKMVELHRGTFCSCSENFVFTVELTLPIRTA